MVWTYDNALARINRLNRTAPEVVVEDFVEQYMPRIHTLNEERRAVGEAPTSPLFDLRRDEAVIVNAVHVYANLLDFDDTLLENHRETEASHARALQFLHFHYSACDRAVEDAGAQRVDFHGARLHAVVTEPADNEAERVRRALELAVRIRTTAARAAEEFGGLASRYRIGIDSGVCVAINSGRGHEREPLFLGNAANFAAKLAEGAEPGVFVSDRVRRLMSTLLSRTVTLTESYSRRGAQGFDATVVSENLGAAAVAEATSRILESWRADVNANRSARSSLLSFVFHYHQPPLASIDYGTLSPSNSIRMPMGTVFADIDGYTSYVQTATASRTHVAQAVRNLHVIRGELAAVVRDDFGGRKVRFIGDCIQALIADGDARTINEMRTVTASIHLAGALRSSFDLTKQVLPGIGSLGLAIGIELGSTPVSRIGIRGDRSVRVAVSKSTIEAEERQNVSDGITTAMGERAFSAGSAAARNYFRDRSVENMTYATAVAYVPEASVPASLETEEPRAHGE